MHWKPFFSLLSRTQWVPDTKDAWHKKEVCRQSLSSTLIIHCDWKCNTPGRGLLFPWIGGCSVRWDRGLSCLTMLWTQTLGFLKQLLSTSFPCCALWTCLDGLSYCIPSLLFAVVWPQRCPTLYFVDEKIFECLEINSQVLCWHPACEVMWRAAASLFAEGASFRGYYGLWCYWFGVAIFLFTKFSLVWCVRVCLAVGLPVWPS